MALTLNLPSLCCSFPSHLHPLYLLVRSICDPWILNFASSASQRHFLRHCLLPRYACRLFPACPSLPRLCLTTKFIAWLTLADDFADDLHSSATALGADPGAAKLWCSRVLGVLQKPLSHSAAPASPPVVDRATILLDALSEIWGEMSAHMPADTLQRFLTQASDHLRAVQLQSSIRSMAAGTKLTPSEFMAIRRPASGFPMGLELLPYTLAINNTDGLDHPLLVELRSLVVDYMCICNDVLSCAAEVAKGDFFNLPCVLASGGGDAVKLQQGLEWAAEMAAGVDARCLEVVRQIRSDTQLLSHQEKVELYLGTLLSCMSGTIQWSFESVRYGLSVANSSYIPPQAKQASHNNNACINEDSY